MIHKKSTQHQLDFWSDEGPYSQAYIKVERRILDDKLARTFLQVEAQINPATYTLVKKHKKYFTDDLFVLQIIETGGFFSEEQGFIALPFQTELLDWPDTTEEMPLFNEAKRILVETENAILRMHTFVLELATL